MVNIEFSSGREQSCSGVLVNGPTIQQWNKNNTWRFKGTVSARQKKENTATTMLLIVLYWNFWGFLNLSLNNVQNKSNLYERFEIFVNKVDLLKKPHQINILGDKLHSTRFRKHIVYYHYLDQEAILYKPYRSKQSKFVKYLTEHWTSMNGIFYFCLRPTQG